MCDNRNRLTSETNPQGSVSYSYDAVSRRTGMTVGGQPQVAYSYDNADRLTGITQGATSAGYSYDNADRLTALTLPNGIRQEYGYDAASQLTGIAYKLGASTLGDLGYGYDGVGRRITQNGAYARTGIPSALASATHNANNQLTNWGGAALTYDNNGNLTGDGTSTYTWNARNQLASMSGGVAASFRYDGFGRRRGKTIAGVSTDFLHDGMNPVQELSGGTPIANMITGLGIDQMLNRTDSAGARSLLTDALGSTIALADSSGAVHTEYTYEPFGKTTVTGALSANSSQYTGRENDGTGLYFYRARYYSPSLGRFLSGDPIGFGGGNTNLYAYVFNSPTHFRDPRGLFCAGPTFGGTVTTGNGVSGAAVTGNISAAGCVDPQQGNSAAVLATGGGFVNSATGESLGPEHELGNTSVGAFAGGGPGVFASNAQSPKDLEGPFNVGMVDVSLFDIQVSFQIGYSGNTWIVGGNVGPGSGIAYTRLVTETRVLASTPAGPAAAGGSQQGTTSTAGRKN